MLLQKLQCPQGCTNSIILETFRTVQTNGNSNLLLDSVSTPQRTEQVKVYICQCCGNSFETHQKSEDNRIVL